MLLPIQNENGFDLHSIAANLEGLEETIIFILINRAQFAENRVVYQPHASGFEGAGEESLFEIRLRRHEEMDAEFGRFCVPEERPFMKGLPAAKRKVALPPTGLHIEDFDVVNVTEGILDAYLSLVGEICTKVDDGQYGSSVEHDVAALQAIARRVHFGALYVAESKFQLNPETYARLARAGDRQGLLRELTRAEVEERILGRIALKVEHIQSQINPLVRKSIPADAIMNFYKSSIIPLTKEGEIRYLLNRAL
jgi:chorismate mutase